MAISVGVVSDVRRNGLGERLADRVNADFLSVDDGSLGCTQNHVRCWRQHAQNPGDWNLNLEDDAVPVDGFRDEIALALDAAPADIVSFYLGSGYIGDNLTAALLATANTIGAHWVVSDSGSVLHAVALAVRGEILAPIIQHLDAQTLAVDRMLGSWALRNSHAVAYSIPSLVDHADEKSLVTKYRRKPRRAFATGRRGQWSSKSISMS